MTLRDFISACPLLAVMRGLRPQEAEDVAEALVEVGLVNIEVPLNSPRPFESIERLVRRFGERALIGAGTVLTADEASRLAAAGGRLAVAPNVNREVIHRAKRHGLFMLPGAATPTEAFAALEAGADGIKMFPAETLLPSVVKAWRAVLPRETLLLPVGGISSANIAAYRSAGADGVGVGSSLYQPGKSVDEIRAEAVKLMRAWKQ